MAPKPALSAIKWGVKDGILFNSLYRMTFMPGCCPILSPGVARRQERPHRECILGNDETDEWNPQLCHLLSAFNIVIARVNGKKKRSSVFKKCVLVEQLHYGKPKTATVSWTEGGRREGVSVHTSEASGQWNTQKVYLVIYRRLTRNIPLSSLDVRNN